MIKYTCICTLLRTLGREGRRVGGKREGGKGEREGEKGESVGGRKEKKRVHMNI